MEEAIVDTDILSYYFRGDIPVTSKFNQYLDVFDVINVSIITYYEIRAGLRYKKADKQLKEFDEFILNNAVIHITEDSAKIAGDIYAVLRQNGISIGTSDILIAGIALENDLMLITNNERHYRKINGLKLGNWKL